MLKEEIDMIINVQILFVHKPTIDMEQSEDILDMPSTSNEANENDDFIKAVKDMTDVILDNVAVMSPVKTVIMKKLLALCTNNNKIDIIIITGNVKSSERDCVNEAVKAVATNRNEFTAEFIRQIEEELMDITRHKAQCGMRDEVLIINLSGPHETKTKCLKVIADMLHSDEYLDTLTDVISSDDDSLEQNTDGNAINRHTEVFPMISILEAVEILNNLLRAYQQNSEIVKINDACGRILYKKVVSNYDMPPFRTSIKHGYAVLVSDGKSLRKVLNLKNTFSPISLLRGTCVWVNSGAPVPDGATAVVQVKDAQLIKRYNSEYIKIMIQPRHGQNIKPIGYDLRKGEIIVDAYTRIGPEEIGLVVASGYKEVKVTSQLSVGVMSIGDNLEEPGKPLKPGYIYDINRITLIFLLKHNRFHSLDYGIVDNKLLSIRDKIREALKEVNILVITGSVDKDLLKKVLTNFFEATIHFGNVDVKPGKSTILATCKINDKTKYFLSLSGNPGSAFIAAHLFLLPFMDKMCSNLNADSALIPACADVPYILHRSPSFSFVSLHWSDEENGAKIYSTGNLFSNKLYNMFGSNALLVMPARTKSKVLSNKTSLPVVLIDYPRKSFSSPLSSPTTIFK